MAGKKAKLHRCFILCRNTIDLWLKRRKETGDYRPGSNRPHRTKAKITDLQAFEKFANQHGDKTQAQMAQLWGEAISPRTISRGLKKIGFTRKKRIMGMKKEMKKPEMNSNLS